MENKIKKLLPIVLSISMLLSSVSAYCEDQCFRKQFFTKKRVSLFDWYLAHEKSRQEYFEMSKIHLSPTSTDGRKWEGAYGINCKIYDRIAIPDYVAYFDYDYDFKTSWSNFSGINRTLLVVGAVCMIGMGTALISASGQPNLKDSQVVTTAGLGIGLNLYAIFGGLHFYRKNSVENFPEDEVKKFNNHLAERYGQ